MRKYIPWRTSGKARIRHERAARVGRGTGVCWIYAFQRGRECGFSLLSLRMVGGHEYALYAASRSVALPLAAVYAMLSVARGVAALAVAMILVQLFDAMIGFRLNDPSGRTAHGLFLR